MRNRARVWEIEFDFFIAQVRDVLFIALYAADDDTADPRSPHHCQAVIDILGRRQPEMLFAPLPSDLPENLALPVKGLRLMSASITDRSAHRWLRLVETAKECLAESSDGSV
jgi:hypothetical protein